MIYKTISTILFFAVISVSFSQESTMGSKDRKYCQTYFSAERSKLLEDYETAINKYIACTEINPNESSAFFELAKILFLRSDIEGAKSYALSAINLERKNKWYFYFLIQLYRSQLDHEKEAEVWEELLDLDPLNVDYYFDCTMAYLDFKAYKQALKTLKSYEKNIGYSEQVFLIKSKIFEEQGEEKKQFKCLQKGIQLFPKSIFLLEAFAQYYIDKSEYDLANNFYAKIMQIEPNNPIALLTSYTIFKNKDNKEEEKRVLIKIINSPNIQELKKQELLYNILTKEEEITFYYDHIPSILENCILMYPESSFFYSVLADFYSLDNKYSLARQYYSLAIEYEKNSTILWERFIYISLLENNYTQTILDADLALERFPLQGNFYYYKGLAQFYEKDYQESVATLQKSLLYIMEDKFLLASIYETLGNSYHELAERNFLDEYHKKSDDSYEKALTYNPNNEYLLNNYSYYLSLRGERLELAKDMIEKCVSITTEPNPSFLDTYAWVLFKLKEYNQAEKIIQKCIEYGGDSAIIFEHYGDILQALGLLNQAVLQWEKALEKEPLNQNLRQKIVKAKDE